MKAKAPKKIVARTGTRKLAVGRGVKKAATKKVQTWHGLPLNKVIGGVTYSLQERFGEDEDYEAKEEAVAYRQKRRIRTDSLF